MRRSLKRPRLHEGECQSEEAEGDERDVNSRWDGGPDFPGMRTKQEPEGQIHEQQAAKIDSKEKNRCEVKEGNQEKNPDSEGPKKGKWDAEFKPHGKLVKHLP